MITLKDLIARNNIEKSAIILLNNLIFDYRKAMVNNNGTYYQFGANILTNIRRISERLISGSYTFEPYVTKILVRHKKSRLIYIATWRDKLVEKWLADGLALLLDKYYTADSYAYRPKKLGISSCQRRLASQIKSHRYVIKRDISQYFYTIPQDKMLEVLSQYVDKEDVLFSCLKQRIKSFKTNNGEVSLGLPFGSPLACVLANLYLHSVDLEMRQLPVIYMRYADDFIMLAKEKPDAIFAKKTFDALIANASLTLKASHSLNLCFNDDTEFTKVDNVSFLGLSFDNKSNVRLGVEKQRKILGLFKKCLKRYKNYINKSNREERLRLVIQLVNDTALSRIRSAAIIDYYLQHINDELQLKNLDMLIAQLVISTTLQKPFRNKDFNTIRYKQLRKLGLISLLHRNRLLRQGHLRINFLNLFDAIRLKRIEDRKIAKRSKIAKLVMNRKSKRHITPPTVSSAEDESKES